MQLVLVSLAIKFHKTGSVNLKQVLSNSEFMRFQYSFKCKLIVENLKLLWLF